MENLLVYDINNTKERGKNMKPMSEFYLQCQEKGYTNMADPTQSLKAKVIATDLNLPYKDIVVFYEKAKQCYLQELQEIEEQKIKQAALAVDGELLCSLYDSPVADKADTAVRVYIRPDASLYCTVNNGPKIEGAPQLSVNKGSVTMVKYHPSQAIYTSATVGGITTGGVHYTKERYSSSSDETDRGYITVLAGNANFEILLIEFSSIVSDRFKHDAMYKKYTRNNSIPLFFNTEDSNFYANAGVNTLNKNDQASMLYAFSMAQDKSRRMLFACEDIAELTVRVVHGQFPPSEEQIFESAQKMAESQNAKDIINAAEMLKSISSYKKAQALLREIQPKLDEAIQLEKERKILEAEEKQKKTKKKKQCIMIALGVIAGGLLVLGLWMFYSNFEGCRGPNYWGEYWTLTDLMSDPFSFEVGLMVDAGLILGVIVLIWWKITSAAAKD